MTHGIRCSVPSNVDIGGCRCIQQRVHEDERGLLIVDLQEQSTQDVLQVYHSVTWADHARDMDTWHLHHEQMDRFFVISGMALFGLSDGNDTQTVLIDSRMPWQLVIPPNVYHCFRVIAAMPVTILNVPDRLYNPDDEIRVPFRDLEVVPPW